MAETRSPASEKSFLPFLTVWLGQAVSRVGSSVCRFALSIWIFQKTGAVTSFALALVCEVAPALLLSPLAGVVADRFPRRTVMLVSDFGAAISMLLVALAIMPSDGSHAPIALVRLVYAAIVVSAAFGAFHAPAYAAAVPSFAPRDRLARANGLIQVSTALAQILGPLLGGVLLVHAGLAGLVLVDTVSFLVAAALLVSVRSFPNAAPHAPRHRASLAQESLEGIRYMARHRGLRALLGLGASIQGALGFAEVLLPPVLLHLTTAATLGTVMAIAGAGALAGGAVSALWEGPRRKVTALLALGFAFGTLLVAAAIRPSVALISIAAFALMACVPPSATFTQFLWQVTLPASLRGRVQAARSAIATMVSTVSFIAAGPLADRVFEPLLLPSGQLAPRLGPIFGTGAGRGTALLVAMVGVAVVMAVTICTRVHSLRELDRD